MNGEIVRTGGRKEYHDTNCKEGRIREGCPVGSSEGRI